MIHQPYGLSSCMHQHSLEMMSKFRNFYKHDDVSDNMIKDLVIATVQNGSRILRLGRLEGNEAKAKHAISFAIFMGIKRIDKAVLIVLIASFVDLMEREEANPIKRDDIEGFPSLSMLSPKQKSMMSEPSMN